MANQSRIYILHGWAVDTHNEQKWDILRQYLAENDLKTVFLGLPGLTVPCSEVWQLDDYLDWLHTQLPDEQVILIGHSFGGQLATVYAARYPNKVKQLILIDSAGLRVHTLLADSKRLLFQLMAKIGKVLLPLSGARKVLYKLAGVHDYLQADPILRKTMANVINYEVQAELTQLVMPTLIIWGAQDTYTPISLAHQFKDAIRDSRLEVVPGARHSPQFTHPEQVGQLIIQFVNSKGRPAEY